MGFIREVRNDIEREALRLMRGYYSMLLAEAKQLCGDDQTAEDLAMKAVETYLAKSEDELPSEDKTGAWLRAAVRNHYQNSIRGKARACTVYVDQTDAERLAELGPVDNSTDEAILAHSDAELVRSAIARLPPDVRSIIMLRYFESLPIRQIAEIIRRSPDSVRSNLYYARKVLAKRLGKMMGRAALAIAAVLFGGSLVYAAAVAVGLAPSPFVAAEPAAEDVVVFNTKSTEDTEGALTGLSANQESQTTGADGDSPQVVAEVTDNFNTNKEENAVNGSIVKKSAAKLVAAAAVLSASTALSGSASITPVPGYDILEYLESSGTQYIDTGVVYANDTKLTQRFCVVDFAGAQMQMGALDNVSGANHRFHWGCRGGVATLEYIAGVGIGGNPGGISAGSDGWVDLTLDATSAGSAFTESGHSTIGLFGRNTGGTFSCGNFRVGQTCIWKGGNLVRNMVPVRRKSDGVLGFYDYCEPKFYENGGSGEFAAGPAMKFLMIAKAIPDSLQSIDSPVEAYYPLPVVKDNTGRTLTKDVDYTVAWANNTRFGEGTCTVSGAGDYATAMTGSATFLIVPQAKLPKGFRRFLYLEATGTVHYVDTDIHPTANTRITALAQTTANANTYLVGILDTPQWRRFHLGAKWISSKHYLAGGVGGNETQNATPSLLVDSGWNKLTMDAANKTLSVNDGTTYTLGTSGTLPTESTLRIFGRMSNNPANSSANPARIADVVVYESGEKTHEFIPCRRESDGVLGLYDVVGKQFLVNSGSAEGGFLAGPELKDDWVSGFIYIVR